MATCLIPEFLCAFIVLFDSMDVEDATTLSYEAFCARYMAPNRPVLLRNVTAKWFKTEQWRDGQSINFKHLKERYGAAMAPVRDSRMTDSGCRTLTSCAVTLSQVVSGDVEEYGAEERWTMRLGEKEATGGSAGTRD